MRVIIFAGLAVLFFYSCNSTDTSPEYVTYKTLPESSDTGLQGEPSVTETYARAVAGKYPGLDTLLAMQLAFFRQKKKFDLDRFRSTWNTFRREVPNRELSQEEVFLWIDLTGFLFQLTAEAPVAEELERIAWQYVYDSPGVPPDSLIMPYVFTRNTDRIHVNLFLPATISYVHSLGGKVTITQKTSFPESGKILLVFGMESKQYIELLVRIPSWATNAEVTVRGVKYLASPGSYSQIAKKWKDGDEVEVMVDLDNLPDYITPGN